MPVEARLFTSPWEGESALVLMLTGVGQAGGDDRQKTFETALRHAKAEPREVRDILDAAADGVVVLDRDAHVQSINRGAEKLFGYASPRDDRAAVRKPVRAGKPARRAANRSTAPTSPASPARATAATSSAAAATAACPAVHDAVAR